MRKSIVLLFVLIWTLTGCVMSESKTTEGQTKRSELRGKESEEDNGKNFGQNEEKETKQEIGQDSRERGARSLVQISCKELEASCEYVTVRDGKIYGCCLADKKNEMQMRIWDSATGKILEEHQVTGDIEPEIWACFRL